MMRNATHIIEVTTVCNLRCPFCIVNHGMRRPHRHMSVDQVVRLADEIASFGPSQEVYLFNYGEPLLHPAIAEIVRLMSQRGIRTKISTNTTNLERVGPAVVKAGLSVMLLDLDGITQDAHETYRAGSDVLVVMDEIRRFMACAEVRDGTTQVILQTLVHSRNIAQLAEIRAFARSVGIRHIAWKSLGLDLGVELSPTEFAEKKRELIPAGTVFDRYAKLLRESDEPCLFAEMNGVVLSNGDYTICTHDADATVVIGNVFVSGYRQLRDSAFMALQEKIAQKKLPPCSGCSMSANLGYVEELDKNVALPGPINFAVRGILLGE